MIQLKQNTVIAGIIWGLVIPFVGVALLMVLDEWTVELVNNKAYIGQKQRTLFLLGICLNLIPFQIYRNRKMDKGLRGVGLITMAYAVLWFIFFASEFI